MGGVGRRRATRRHTPCFRLEACFDLLRSQHPWLPVRPSKSHIWSLPELDWSGGRPSSVVGQTSSSGCTTGPALPLVPFHFRRVGTCRSDLMLGTGLIGNGETTSCRQVHRGRGRVLESLSVFVPGRKTEPGPVPDHVGWTFFGRIFGNTAATLSGLTSRSPPVLSPDPGPQPLGPQTLSEGFDAPYRRIGLVFLFLVISSRRMRKCFVSNDTNPTAENNPKQQQHQTQPPIWYIESLQKIFRRRH